VPVRRDGKLYGRGGADDGYAVFSSLTAIRTLQEQGIPHGRCVILIEGCEESGSFDLPFYVEALKARMDALKHSPEPFVTYGLMQAVVIADPHLAKYAFSGETAVGPIPLAME